MAEARGQKRNYTDEFLQSDSQPLTKKVKTTNEPELDAQYSWVYPPEFYDRLSKVHLNRRVLDELQQRNSTQQSRPSRPVETSLSILSKIQNHRDVVIFARCGGPDLGDLRGYPYPPVEAQWAAAMAATHTFSPSIAPPSFALASSQANNLVQSSSKPSPFDMNFGTHLADFHIHRFYATPAPNLEELKAAVAVPRPPLSLSEFSESDFKAFSNSVRDAGTLREILYDVIPMLTGSEVSHYVTAQDVVFNNLRPLTDGCIAAARPHLYDGASPVTDHKAIRDQLGDMIVPSTAEGTPVVPNFFLEVADHANVEAARLQARFHGAIGARAMHSLQNFGK